MILPAPADLLRAGNRRIVFVVGKGGVGKTTTAAALALAFADSGAATHLLSTDPAHSLGDVFGVALPGHAGPSPCTPLLTLEELDARAYARAWIERISGPIAELVQAGTYLDATDARALADLSLPGVDVVMGALRLVELARGPAARIVVDTAPTGHALRLLETGGLVRGWVAALDAMAAKARAVSTALVHVALPAPGEEVLRELRAQVAAFQDGVLARAGFVVVTRPGAIIAAETERLVAELRRRGLALDALVVTGGDAANAGAAQDAPAVVVPWLSPPPRGCESLRAWARPELPAPPAALTRARAVAPTGNAAATLVALPQQLFLFAGKGGVGKTTCASAFALGLARRTEVVLLSTDPAGSLADVFGVQVAAEGTRLGALELRQVDAVTELARVQGGYRRQVQDAFEALGLDGAAALDRDVMEALWGLAPPGLDELLALVRMLRTLESGARLVIDPAPTGHFLRLLELPAQALDWTHALMRLVLKYRLASRLDAIARELLEFARDLKVFLTRLADPGTTAAFVVTLDEPVVLAETERLLGHLAGAHVPLAGVILNRAEAGPLRGMGAQRSRVAAAGAPAPLVLSPSLPAPPVGPDALRAFLGSWEIAT
ncbi:MAG TPA: ArsA family ATPase [Longimicrobiales bacterium]